MKWKLYACPHCGSRRAHGYAWDHEGKLRELKCTDCGNRYGAAEGREARQAALSTGAER